ncbi:MAG: hypothetical protein PHV18_05130 [Lachnospiraceae bacterium]|nr:hypothetical protein [Lachnospiraceae bacterium]
MEERIVERLKSLGYPEVSNGDRSLILCIVRKVEQEIRNYCNRAEIPDELAVTVVENTCGEFLLMKKLSGEVLGFDLEACVSSLSEGDSSVSFDVSMTPEKRLDSVIGYLTAYGRDGLNRFRKVVW